MDNKNSSSSFIKRILNFMSRSNTELKRRASNQSSSRSLTPEFEANRRPSAIFAEAGFTGDPLTTLKAINSNKGVSGLVNPHLRTLEEQEAKPIHDLLLKSAQSIIQEQILQKIDSPSVEDRPLLIKTVNNLKIMPLKTGEFNAELSIQSALDLGQINPEFKALFESTLDKGAFRDIQFNPSRFSKNQTLVQRIIDRTAISELGKLAKLQEIRPLIEANLTPQDLLTPALQEVSGLNEAEKNRLGLVSGVYSIVGSDLGVARSIVTEALENRDAKSFVDIATWKKKEWVGVLQQGNVKDKAKREELIDRIRVGISETLPMAALVSALPSPEASEVESQIGLLSMAYPGLELEKYWKESVSSNEDKSIEIVRKFSVIKDLVKHHGKVDYLRSDLDELPDKYWSNVSPGDLLWLKQFIGHYQVLFNISGSADGAVELALEGVRHAQDVVSSDKFPDAIKSKACKIVGEICNGALSILQLNELPKPVDNQSGEIQSNFGNAPGFTELFANRSSCQCEHCRSVLSPAAYFVDLMNYIAKVEGPERADLHEDNPFRLKSRRQDLWDMPLSCEATHDEIPYLDIVNEILKKKLEVRDGNERYLENVQTRADSFYWPQNPILKETDEFLTLLKVQRAGIVRFALGSSESNFKARIASARLNIDQHLAATIEKPLEANELTTLFSVPIEEIDDYAIGDIEYKPLKSIDMQTLVKACNLSREELITMLETDFVKGDADFTIEGHKRDASSFQNDTEILVKASLSVMNRLAQFIRIWQVLSSHTTSEGPLFSKYTDLSLLLSSIGKVNLIEIGRAVRLQKAWALKVDEVCGLFSPLPSRRIGQKKYKNLAFDVFGSDKKSLLKELQNYSNARPRLMALLNLSAGDVDAIANVLNSLDSDHSLYLTDRILLNPMHLAAFYRYSRIAEAEGKTAQEIVNLCRIAGIKVLDDLSTNDQLFDTLQWWNQGNLSVDTVLEALEKREDNQEEAKALVEELSQSLGSYSTSVDGLKTKVAEGIANKWHWSPSVFTAFEKVFARGFGTDSEYHEALKANAEENKRTELVLYIHRLCQLKNIAPSALVEFRDNVPSLVELLAISDVKLFDLTINVIQQCVLGAIQLTLYRHQTNQRNQDSDSLIKLLLQSDSITSEIVHRCFGVDIQFSNSLLENWPDLSDEPLTRFNQLIQRISLCKSLSLNGQNLRELAHVESLDSLETINTSLKDTLRVASSKDKMLQEKLESIEQSRRATHRDILVALLIEEQSNNSQPVSFQSAKDLNDYYLIDVNRGGCAKTTRVATALSSLQMYLNRIREDMESRKLNSDVMLAGIKPRYIKDYEWNLRRSYRLWEAAKRIFLYPENYLEPDLRDDKSELFREFEESLLQGEVTTQNALRAYQAYVKQFSALSTLQISGSYCTGKDADDITVLCGCTAEDPPVHYIQTYQASTGEWSEWQKINVSIPVRYVSPVLANNTLRLYWLTQNTRASTRFSDGSSELTSYRHNVTHYYAERLPDGNWSQPQSLDVDFSSLGYGLKNVVLDRFALQDAISNQINESEPLVIVIKTSSLFNLSEPLNCIVDWKGYDTNRKNTFTFNEDGRNELFEDSAIRIGGTRIPGIMMPFIDKCIQESEIKLQVNNSDGDIRIYFNSDSFDSEATIERIDGFLVIADKDYGKFRNYINNFEVKLGIDRFDFSLSSAPAQLRSLIERLIIDDFPLVADVTPEPVPIFDHRPHWEVEDSYRLHNYGWAHPFPRVTSNEHGSQTQLIVPGDIPTLEARFQAFDINFINRTLKRTSYTTAPSISPWLRLNGNKLSVDSFNLSTTDLPNWFDSRDEYATRQWYANPDASDFASALISAHGRETTSNEFNLQSLSDTNIIHSVVTASSVSLNIVNGTTEDGVLNIDGESFLIRGSLAFNETNDDNSTQNSAYTYEVLRLGTTLGKEISKQFSHGLDYALNLSEQLRLAENHSPFKLGVAVSSDKTIVGELPFEGPMGIYLRELYFHIPYTVANYLNSQGRYAEAERWYEFLFDPTAEDMDEDQTDQDRVWRSRYLRGTEDKELRDIFPKEPGAIERFERDPFNPYTVARIRRSAFQKAVVLRYVSNLIDHGDTLFRKFQREPLEQALGFYLRAQELMGDRQYEIGSCGETGGTSYQEISTGVKKENNFFFELEKKIATSKKPRVYKNENQIAQSVQALSKRKFVKVKNIGKAEAVLSEAKEYALLTSEKEHKNIVAVAPTFHAQASATVYSQTKRSWKGTDAKTKPKPSAGRGLLKGACTIPKDIIDQISQLVDGERPVFCVPANNELRELWDKLESRIFNLRHCRDIEGNVRHVSPFAPALDPGAVAQAANAGLDLSSFVSGVQGKLPPYRFTYLIEKAKACAATVQSLGSALQSALITQDAESLTILRSQNEIQLLELNEKTREYELQSAKEAIKGLGKRKEIIEYRLAYNEQLLETGLIPAEILQKQGIQTASELRKVASTIDLLATIFHLIPEIGSPFSMKFGGFQLGESSVSWSEVMKQLATIYDAQSSSAAIEANFTRRAQGWEHQIELASRELGELESQMAAAEIRLATAEDGIVVHQTQVEQSEAIYSFHKEKFSKIGHYIWTSNLLQKLLRKAYHNTLIMAQMAERAYEFETKSSSTNVFQDLYWSALHVGLLSGEQLTNALNDLESKYIKGNVRTPEITQIFSLSEIDPKALLNLQYTGSSKEFKIIEEHINLAHPGYYSRSIQDVKITIIAIKGPSVDLGAELELIESEIRKKEDESPTPVEYIDSPKQIALSHGINDGGRFEINFRDERYTPFEGHGVISKWVLRLPARVRQFDYSTISDVQLEINYKALRNQGASSRNDVEINTETWLSTQSTDRKTMLSIKQCWPNAWATLLRGEQTSIEFKPEFFPYFMVGRTVKIDNIQAALISKNSGAPQINLNGSLLPILYGQMEHIAFVNLGASENRYNVQLRATDDNGEIDSTLIKDIILLVGYSAI